MSTVSSWTRRCSSPRTRCRSASSGSSTTRAPRRRTGEAAALTASPEPRRPGSGREVTRSIGQVLTVLSGEFPDISISKIRFLESEGLITPQRAPSGYRRYAEHDVERLRYVLLVQREHYLPLKVIREPLEMMDRGQTPPEPKTLDVAAAGPAGGPGAQQAAPPPGGP